MTSGLAPIKQLDPGLAQNYSLVKKYFLLALLIFGALFFSYRFFQQKYQSDFSHQAIERTTLYRSTLIASLERVQHLPFVLSQDSFVINALLGKDINLVSERFEKVADQSGAAAIYLMDLDGKTLASSNWQSAKSFVGENYRFRPYFQQAVKGGNGVYFAIGVTTGEPGYFVSSGVRGPEGNVLGVVAVKIDLRPLEKSWLEGGEHVFVTNEDGIIVLTSNDHWRYKTIGTLDEATRQSIEARRQFPNQPLVALDYTSLQHRPFITIEDRPYLRQFLKAGRLNWDIHYLIPAADLDARVNFSLAIVGAIILMGLIALIYLRSKQIHRELELSRRDTETLRKLNEKLESEVTERRRTQQRLQKTKQELEQASKLAALGQLSASVSHELSQPLSAMKNYIASAQLPLISDATNPAVPNNQEDQILGSLDQQVDRMIKITKDLKTFSRKRHSPATIIDLSNVVEASLKTMAPFIQAGSVTVKREFDQSAMLVKADRDRLQQVLVNVIRNALDAMETCHNKNLTINLETKKSRAILSVSDSGNGIASNIIEHIFDPFVTTKLSGQGLGLGLAISADIMTEMGGALRATNSESGGAVFSLEFPLVDCETITTLSTRQSDGEMELNAGP